VWLLKNGSVFTSITGSGGGAGYAKTDASGNYSFSGLLPGTYTVSEVQQPGWVQTAPNPNTYTLTIDASGTVTTNGRTNTGNDFGNFNPPEDVRISIRPDDVNEVGQPHTFTALVETNDGIPASLGGDGSDDFVRAPAGTAVTIDLAGLNGAVPDINLAAAPAAANPSSASGTTDANGEFKVTFTSATAGKVIGNASTTVTIGDQTISRDTDPTTATTPAGPGGSGPATKYFVDARVTIAPAADVNPVGDNHTVTALVELNDGTGTGFRPFEGANVVVSLSGQNGAAPVASTSLSGTSDATGHFSVTFSSAKAGLVLANATATITNFDLDGAAGPLPAVTPAIVRDTDPNTNTPAGPGGSGPAVKRWVDAYVDINPDGTNPVGAPHTFTVSVFQNDGLAIGAPGGDAYNGFGAVGAGVPVTMLLTNSNGAVADPAGPFSNTTNANGQFSVTFTSQTPGTVTGHGTADVSFARVANEIPGTPDPIVVHRETDGQQTVPGSGQSNSDDAVKTFVAPGDIRMTGGGSVFLPDKVLDPSGKNTVVGGAGGTRVTHGFQLHCAQNSKTGGPITDVNNRLEINWGKPNQHFHLEYLTAVTCKNIGDIDPAPPPFTAGGPDTLIGEGIGRYTGTFNGKRYNKAEAKITFILTDAGEPGISDTSSYIVTLTNGTATTADDIIVLNTGDKNGDNQRTLADFDTSFQHVPADQLLITKGNHQVHPELKILTSAQAAIDRQMINTLNQMDNANISDSKLDSLLADLVAEIEAYNATL
jgi:hypothetical protein